ncbi:hypothetical protein EOA13_36220 [Mesorhizobium sp. M7A.F.Ca.US.011.01.1.1]|uniref:N,N-dimethylformamidase beta subunit family domain-containing protein n=1 Tax=Mesorhizobium sp. M7A.F.Ca.US.011.01.1.1 TaxID=2496741 RepID=UPI000FCB7E0E|nr:N,N-dimethylformamidase beta subunit family domain-containing protein [Mesorhizobium sp. M7A.F.Ca.US.011.01.1.1]RUX22295.1 hypothetical protein EOA13_36220 [Mesorhizobium sp. M7A.F.Ca.US.011.01.1.1]
MLDGRQLRGYTQSPNIPAGSGVTIHVSSDVGDYEATLVRLINGDPNPSGPGFKEEEVRDLGRFKGRRQETRPGNMIRADLRRPMSFEGGFTFHAFVKPTRPRDGYQVIASQGQPGKAGWELSIRQGRMAFSLVDSNGNRNEIACDKPFFDYVWYAVSVTVDTELRSVTLRQRSVINGFNSRFGPVVPIDAICEKAITLTGIPAIADDPVTLGAALSADGKAGLHCYNGKLDSPVIFEACLGAEDLRLLDNGHSVVRPESCFARWDFSYGISLNGIATDHVQDVSGNEQHGVCHNQPIRACTGWNWKGKFDCYMVAPQQYGAIWFHSDALEDCGWDADFTLDVPEDASSGVYSVRLRGGGYEDYVTFFVTPAAKAKRAPIAVIMPTFTYMSYSNFYPLQHWAADESGFDGQEANNGGVSIATTRDFEIAGGAAPYGVANYERHVDGSGAIFATWRRPQIMLRPKHLTSWNFQGDLCLIDWLEESGFEYDVITDHDVHEGAQLLGQYKVVVTCTHPEYTTTAYNDAWEQYLERGGRGMYLGGNGMYWVTAQPQGKPWLIEVRRGETGDGAWQSEPGEQYTSSTGEHGGLWRMRGRAGYKIWGTSYIAHALEQGGYYVQLPDSKDARVRWIFEGIEPGETIGAFGHWYKGAASVELDRYDLGHGTPPHTMLLSSSVEHGPNATIVPEEMGTTHPFINGIEHPKVRADMTYFTTPEGGAMFSSSSIGWCHSLNWNGYRNNVSRLTENVLKRFASADPLPEVV